MSHLKDLTGRFNIDNVILSNDKILGLPGCDHRGVLFSLLWSSIGSPCNSARPDFCFQGHILNNRNFVKTTDKKMNRFLKDLYSKWFFEGQFTENVFRYFINENKETGRVGLVTLPKDTLLSCTASPRKPRQLEYFQGDCCRPGFQT